MQTGGELSDEHCGSRSVLVKWSLDIEYVNKEETEKHLLFINELVVFALLFFGVFL